MRYGFTTGSCAAAAAKAAAYMLLTGSRKNQISIQTPKGIWYHAEILDIKRENGAVSCAVEKDGGDDPDITTGVSVYARVAFGEKAFCKDAGLAGEEFSHDTAGGSGARVVIDGGAGVGRVTKPGLDQPVGNAAINRVPREMIEKEVLEICGLMDYTGILYVEISVPEGKRVAEKTFNPRLGIVGGISILGTSGIVEPMSSQALLETIKVELRQKKAEGQEVAFVSPGNYGVDFMKNTYGCDLDKSVKCSNFIGDTVDMAAELGFQEMLLTGHIGKLVKLAGGIMNTHSREGDCRMELIAAAAVRSGTEQTVVKQVLDCVATEEAIRLLAAAGKKEDVMERIMEQVMFYLRKRAAGRLNIECIIYANDFGELGKSSGAECLLGKVKEA